MPAAGHGDGARIGVISDTHGLLRPEAIAFLDGCDHIVHAGDIGKPDILDALAGLAPLLWWFLVDRLATARRAPLWLVGLVVTAPWPLVAGVLA